MIENMVKNLVERFPDGDVARAIEFARTRHAGQIRLNGEPHFFHVVRVAEGIATATQEKVLHERKILVQAALLHDVVEDTDTTIDEVAQKFGTRVAHIVSALSHYEEEELDEEYLGRIAAAGPDAVLVKRYDRIDNIFSLANAPVEFRNKKIREINNALPIWRRIDPKGIALIECALLRFQS